MLNDEAHHVVNETKTQTKRWKEFLQSPDYGFKYIIGVSGTCYVGDDYFDDVIYRYSLRTSIEERFAKKVHYVAEMPRTDEREEKWQLIVARHEEIKRKLRSRNLLPMTIIVTPPSSAARMWPRNSRAFSSITRAATPTPCKSRCWSSTTTHPTCVACLTWTSATNKVEWIVSVSMLNEGWDVKRVFQIVPHEERAFNSKLLIAQVLGAGCACRRLGSGEQPEVTIFNHDRWAPRIRHLVNEVLEIEKRISCRVVEDSPYHFDLHNIDYDPGPAVGQEAHDRRIHALSPAATSTWLPSRRLRMSPSSSRTQQADRRAHGARRSGATPTAHVTSPRSCTSGSNRKMKTPPSAAN